MNKQETLVLKGIALLMMIMVHVNTNDTIHITFWEDWSFWRLLSNVCHPVAFFLLLSGYGLRYVYENGDKHHYGRIIKVYVHYWTIMFLFVFIGMVKFGCDMYPGDALKIIDNLTSFHTSYNFECWFLFPFAILSLSYPFTLKALDKFGVGFIVLTCLIYFVSGYVISHYHLIYKTAPHGLYNIIQVFFLLFTFVLGAALKKYAVLDKIKNKIDGQNLYKYKVCAFILLLFMMVLRCFYHTSAFGPFESIFVFIIVFVLLQNVSCGILKLIGKHSMNIWMIHTYFLHYLFHDEIYSLRYTLLVYSAALLLSLVASYGINILTKGIDRRIYNSNV